MTSQNKSCVPHMPARHPSALNVFHGETIDETISAATKKALRFCFVPSGSRTFPGSASCSSHGEAAPAPLHVAKAWNARSSYRCS